MFFNAVQHTVKTIRVIFHKGRQITNPCVRFFICSCPAEKQVHKDAEIVLTSSRESKKKKKIDQIRVLLADQLNPTTKHS